MTDGNKESIKEVLSTFRALFAADISLIILITNPAYIHSTKISEKITYYPILYLYALSLIFSFMLFLIAIPKISRQDEDIAYSKSIFIPALISFLSFIIASVLLILSQIYS